VTIKDFESIVKNISKVQVTVDVSNLDRDLTIEESCKFYNSTGQEYTAFKKNIPVNVKLEVAKEISVIPDVKGTPAKNFINTENKVSPNKILAIGPPEILNGINELKTEPVDIENKSSNVEFKCRLKVPDGIKILNASDSIVVSATIEQVGRVDFNITKDNIEILNREIDNTLNYEIQTQEIQITLKGKTNVLKKINMANLKPNINVSTLTEGTHRLPLNLNLPGDVRPVDIYEIDVRIDKR
jgi:YbbR domain-containing protein